MRKEKRWVRHGVTTLVIAGMVFLVATFASGYWVDRVEADWSLPFTREITLLVTGLEIEPLALDMLTQTELMQTEQASGYELPLAPEGEDAPPAIKGIKEQALPDNDTANASYSGGSGHGLPAGGGTNATKPDPETGSGNSHIDDDDQPEAVDGTEEPEQDGAGDDADPDSQENPDNGDGEQEPSDNDGGDEDDGTGGDEDNDQYNGEEPDDQEPEPVGDPDEGGDTGDDTP